MCFRVVAKYIQLKKINVGYNQIINQKNIKFYDRACASSAAVSFAKNCYRGDLLKNNSDALILGDSHSRTGSYIINDMLKEAKLKGLLIAASAHLLLLSNNAKIKRDIEITKLIDENNYKYVILGGLWENYTDNLLISNNKDSYLLFEKYFEDNIKFIIKSGAIPVIILNNPSLYGKSRLCNTNSTVKFFYDSSSCFNDADIVYKEQKRNLLFFKKLKTTYSKIIIIDPNEIICNKKKCFTTLDGVPLYQDDSNHLNAQGASYIGELYLKKYGNPFLDNYHYMS